MTRDKLIELFGIDGDARKWMLGEASHAGGDWAKPICDALVVALQTAKTTADVLDPPEDKESPTYIYPDDSLADLLDTCADLYGMGGVTAYRTPEGKWQVSTCRQKSINSWAPNIHSDLPTALTRALEGMVKRTEES